MSVNRIWKGGLSRKNLQWATGALGLLPIGLAVFSVPVFAQIVPDNTLGNESSLVTPNVNIRGLPAERIDGGAVRGSALFHSFSEFNVNNGQQVYFSNPAGIADIFSRVTGLNVSNILGTLGVDGGANLFVLNPNGILFGPNAQLDIQGSFLATTGSSFKFSDGSEFSATQPTSAPLLSINVTPGVQWGASQPGATITNRGNLKAGEDLTLAGGNLDVQGQLQAGRDLTLQAQDTLTVRDTVTMPFVAQSGGNLTVQGNQSVDIFALNHPQSQLQSGGNFSLISNGDISGDAHFSSGSNLSMLTLAGTPGNFVSWYDPIIRANGDVQFGNYTGVALKVEATGSIQGGNIRITGPDSTIPVDDPDYSTLTGSPSVILRAGLASVSTPNLPQNGLGNPPTNFTSGANALGQAPGSITVASIDTSSRTGGDGGSIILSATGNITTTGSFADPRGSNYSGIALGSFSYSSSGNSGKGGVIALSAGGNITTNGNLSSYSSSSSTTSETTVSGNGGAIALSAGGNITTNGNLDSFSSATGKGEVITIGGPANNSKSGNGGAITLTAGGDIATNGNFSSGSSYNPQSNANSHSRDYGNGGAITLMANGTVNISNRTFHTGGWYSGFYSGDVRITGKTVNISNSRFDTSFPTMHLGSGIGDNNRAYGGDVQIRADETVNISGSRVNTGSIDSVSGDVQITAGGTVDIKNSTFDTQSSFSSITYSGSEDKVYSVSRGGQGGNVMITADSTSTDLNKPAIKLTDVYIPALAYGTGTSGDIKIEAINKGAVSLVGNNAQDAQINSASLSFVEPKKDQPTGGNITIAGGPISISNYKLNASVTNSALENGTLRELNVGSRGDGGNISIQSSASVSIQGSSRIATTVEQRATGNGGNVKITGQSVEIANNSSVIAGTASAGNSGNVSIAATGGSVSLKESKVTTSSTAQGNAGNIKVTANAVDLSNRSEITAETTTSGKEGFGNILLGGLETLRVSNSRISTSTASGTAGNVTVEASELVNLSGTGTFTLFGQKVTQGGVLAQATQGGNAGSINITTRQFSIEDGAQATVSSTATGRAGNLTVNAPDVLLRDGANLAATTQAGNGGNIQLQNLSSLQLFNNSQISASTQNGTGGNVSVEAKEGTVQLSGNSRLAAEATNGGSAGGVTINTQQLTIEQGAQVAASSKNGSGTAGDVDITAKTVTLNNGKVTAETDAGGSTNPADITLGNLNTLNLSNNSSISASTQTGQAGSINLNQGGNPATSVSLNNSSISAQATEQGGNAGGVTLNTSQLSLENDAKISASNVSGTSEDITLQGLTSLSLSNDSEISASTQSGKGGDISVQASGGTVTLIGNSRLEAEATNGGDAGNLDITANQLRFRDGSSATVSSTSGGTAGKLAVSAPEVIVENSARLAATTEKGSGGDIQLQNLSSLQLRNSSEISASTVSGKGGSVSVNAQGGTVALTGNSHIKSEANGGQAGNLDITANRLTLRDNSSATVSSTGGGTAGKLAVSAPEVILEYSAKLAATTQAGSGGDIQLQNLSSLQLNNGSEISASTASGRGGNVSVNAPGGTITLTDNSSLKAEATNGGNAGNLDITANQLTLRDRSSATVSSPQGQAGNLSITANNLLLDRGEITAATGTRSEQGGANIKLQVSDLLLLRHQSLISANATGDANGGNITISAPFVVAVPSENNDIIANAVSGDGGRINILDNYRVFGLKPQSGQEFKTLRNNRTSDISASSQSGIQGVINIQSLSVDPSQGLTQLPVEVIDPSRQIVNRCGAGNAKSTNAQGEFVVTGRGGLPPSPDDMQRSGAITPGWVTRDGGNSSRLATPVEPPATPSTPPLVEAQGMFINAKGEVVLTAQTPTTTPHQPGIAELVCSPATNGNE